MKDNGLNQEQFAQRLGVKQSMVSDWVNAKHSPSRSTQKLIEVEFYGDDKFTVNETHDSWPNLKPGDKRMMSEMGAALSDDDEVAKLLRTQVRSLLNYKKSG